jgi:hypothetical protein
MKEGQVCYLARPDDLSLRSGLVEEHGRLWVFVRFITHEGHPLCRFKSLATGKDVWFDAREMDISEQPQ